MSTFGMRSILFSLLVVQAALCTASADEYHLTPLGILGGTYGNSYATGVNDFGQVVGVTYAQNIGYEAFVYSNGVMTGFGGDGTVATSINDVGQVVGYQFPNDSKFIAYTYQAGVLTSLGTLGGPTSLATSINNSGQIVGASDTGVQSSFGIYVNHGFIYENGDMQDLGVDFGPSTISETGEIVGSTADPDTSLRMAVIYDSGSLESLGTLGGDWSDATGFYDFHNYFGGGHFVNAFGEIVGSSGVNGNDAVSHAFLYNQGHMVDLGTLGGEFVNSAAESINDSGVIVGADEDYDYIGSTGFIYANGVMRDLNSVLDASATGYTIIDAIDISDTGYICANAWYPDGSEGAVLLTPQAVPGPPTVSVFVLGVAAIFRRRRKKDTLQ